MSEELNVPAVLLDEPSTDNMKLMGFYLTAKYHGMIDEHGRRAMTTRQMASMLSMSRNTVMRLLSQLEDLGLVVKDRSEKAMYCYLMRNKRNGFIKIGRSTNPGQREKTLQSEEPEIEMIFFREAPSEVEAALHREFATWRVRGEWFELSKEQIGLAKDMIEELCK